MDPPIAPVSNLESNIPENHGNIVLQNVGNQDAAQIQVPSTLQRILPSGALQRLLSTIQTGQNVLNQSVSNQGALSRTQIPARSPGRNLQSPADENPPPNLVDSGSDIESGSGRGSSAEAAPVDPEAEQALESQRQQQQNAIDLQNGLRNLMRYLAYNLPFFIICVGLLLYTYFASLVTFIWNLSTLISLNTSIKAQVAKKERREIQSLLGSAFYAILHIVATYYVFPASGLLFDAVLMRGMRDPTFVMALWLVANNDLLIRFACMATKCLAIVLVGHRPPFERRGRLYAAIDILFHIGRMILPIPIWLSFFNSIDHVVPKSLFLSLYCAAKAFRTLQRLRLISPFLLAYFSGHSPFGKYATEAQIRDSNADSCSVCQDNFVSPVALGCSHIFCENCIASWFEREATCPLCRATVSHAGNPSHVDGSTHIQFEIF